MKIKFKAFSTRYQNILTNFRSDYLFLDLSKNLDFSGKAQTGTTTDGEKFKDLLVLNNIDDFCSLRKLYCSIEDQMQTVLESPNDTKAKRLLINNLGSFVNRDWLKDTAQVCQFLNALKMLLRSTHCVCILSIPKSGLAAGEISGASGENFGYNEILRRKIIGYADLYIGMEV